jgi:DNA relaxase NicK
MPKIVWIIGFIKPAYEAETSRISGWLKYSLTFHNDYLIIAFYILTTINYFICYNFHYYHNFVNF